MSTVYQTPRGASYEPIVVELWTYTGQPLGRVGDFEKLEFTWSDREAQTCELDVYLDELTAPLLECDGTVLIVARMNGMTHITVPVQATAKSGEHPSIAMIHVIGAGGWTLLDGQVLPPTLFDPVTEQVKPEYQVEGALESVLKMLIGVGVQRTGHPLIIAPSNNRGPTVSLHGAWETVAEQCRKLLEHSGFMLTMQGWVPGDPQPFDDANLEVPTTIVDFAPYRQQPGLVWSVDGGDMAEWNIDHKRATANRVTVGNGAEKPENLSIVEMRGQDSGSPWDVRETYQKVENPKGIGENGADEFMIRDNLEVAGRTELATKGRAVEVDVQVTDSAAWEFGTDGAFPRQFQVGDIATVMLPVVGEVTQVITSVTVTLTPDDFTVTPKISTPDSPRTDIYAQVAETTRRVIRIEREN